MILKVREIWLLHKIILRISCSKMSNAQMKRITDRCSSNGNKEDPHCTFMRWSGANITRLRNTSATCIVRFDCCVRVVKPMSGVRQYYQTVGWLRTDDVRLRPATVSCYFFFNKKKYMLSIRRLVMSILSKWVNMKIIITPADKHILNWNGKKSIQQFILRPFRNFLLLID